MGLQAHPIEKICRLLVRAAVGGTKSELVIRLENAFADSGLNVKDFKFEVGETVDNDDLEVGQRGGLPTKQILAIDMTAMLQMYNNGKEFRKSEDMFDCLNEPKDGCN